MHASITASHTTPPFSSPLLLGPLLCDGQRNTATAILIPASSAAVTPDQSQLLSLQCLYVPQHTQMRPERPMVIAAQQDEGAGWTLRFSPQRPHFTWNIKAHGEPAEMGVAATQIQSSTVELNDIRRTVHVTLSFNPTSREAAMHIHQTDSAHTAARTVITLPPNAHCPFNADSPLWVGGSASEAGKSDSPFCGLIAQVHSSTVHSGFIEQSIAALSAEVFAHDVIRSHLAARGWTDNPGLMCPWPSTAEPIHSLSQLLAWQPGSDPLHIPRQRDVLPRCAPFTPCAQVIHCHDMAYRSDVDGQHGSAEFHAYAFRFWKYIDIFLYFSHARIALPPVAWIQAAHTNGVKILANFCTEWSEGERENARLLAGVSAFDADSKPMWQRYADAMVALAVEHAFDGWFLNIEAPLPAAVSAESASACSPSSSSPELSPSADNSAPIQLCGSVLRLCEFIAYLRDAMHVARPGSLVIVYDSLLASSGQVKWQSKLSRENECFLDCSDGLFTDYHWKQDWPAESVKLAENRSDSPSDRDRRLSLFTGIDLFGRGTFGGGGFDAWKALDVIRSAGTSIALFAPAWTYEGEGRRERGWQAFQAAENRLWVGVRGMHEIEAKGLGPVANPGSEDSCGWTLTSGGHGWKIVPHSEQDSSRFAFIASHKLCLREKRIDLLDHFTQAHLATNPAIRIQTEFAGTGPNVADAYQLCVQLLAEDGSTVMDEFRLHTVAASNEFKQVEHTFRGYSAASSLSSSSTVRFVSWTDGGQDAEHWAGHFGTRIGDSRVWVAPHMHSSDDNQDRAKCIADYVEPRSQSLLSLLPFVHSFNTGNGHDFFLHGRSVSATSRLTADPAPWFNLSLQDNQMVLADCFIAAGATQRGDDVVVRAECSHSVAAFEGGSCLLFECATDDSSAAAASVLFDCFEYGIDDRSKEVASASPVDLSFVWTTTSPAWRIALILESDANESGDGCIGSSSVVVDRSSRDCQVDQLDSDWMRVRARISMALVSAIRRIRLRVSYNGSNPGPASIRLGQVRVVASGVVALQLTSAGPSAALTPSSLMSVVEPTAVIAALSRLLCTPHFLLSSLLSARLVASFSFSWDEPNASVLSYDVYLGVTWRARVLLRMYFAPTLRRCSIWSSASSASAAPVSSSLLALTSSSVPSRPVANSCDSSSSITACPCSFRVVANLATGERLQLQWRSQ